MSAVAPILAKSTSNRSSASSSSSSAKVIPALSMLPPPRELNGPRLFQYYVESFFKIPKDIKNDIIYCQRSLKAHIKVHQMVIDVFNQQPDADVQQKKRILNELESEIYEINAEQHYLFLRLRRITDEFYKMIRKNGIPINHNLTNALISKEIVPLINDAVMEIAPVSVCFRLSEEKLVEKYFEVQKDNPPPPPPATAAGLSKTKQCAIIDLDDDCGNVMEKVARAHSSGKSRNIKKEKEFNNSNYNNGESLLKNMNNSLAQKSLLKPMNQRMSNDIHSTYASTVVTGAKSSKSGKNVSIGEMYKKVKEENSVEMPVSSNVTMSRMNLRQALKRAQAAVRGPATALPPPPPPPPPPQPVPAVQAAATSRSLNENLEWKKSSASKARVTRAATAATAAVLASIKTTTATTEASSSSEDGGTPERGPTPPHSYWPDELEETRTKAEEYGQEMFLRIFDLFTPEVHAHMQQRRSKRRRRCVQNNERSYYHYGRFDGPPPSSALEKEPKKRKAFLLSPQVKKALPAKRAKRRSNDNNSEGTSVPPSRSASSSPDDKRSCNECLKGGNGYDMEQCEECKLHYHQQCHREEDDSDIMQNAKKLPSAINTKLKLCPRCKKLKKDSLIKKEFMLNKKLQDSVQELELQLAKEKDRREILQRTSELYKIQMNNLFKVVNALKSDSKTESLESIFPDDNVITLD